MPTRTTEAQLDNAVRSVGIAERILDKARRQYNAALLGSDESAITIRKAELQRSLSRANAARIRLQALVENR